MERIYLDWAATAAPDPGVLSLAAKKSSIYFANPSSPNEDGKRAGNFICECRKKLAAIFGTKPEKLFFTSGGTESNNIIISSLLNKKRPGNIVISAIEHSSVYEPVKQLRKSGWEIREIKPDSDRQLFADSLMSAIDKDTRLVSIMMVNNETGAVLPVQRIGQMLSEKDFRNRVHYHIDAVQAAGKYSLNLDGLGADSVSISSHKFQGPRGCGILYLDRDIDPVFRGGGQEGGIRSGTENTFGIAGSLIAAEGAIEHLDDNLSHALELKKIMLSRLSEIPGLNFNPNLPAVELLNTDIFSPYILSLNLKPLPGEIIVRVMSDSGFDISTGSACAAGKKAGSRVLEAFGLDRDSAYASIRISTGHSTKLEEISSFCDTFVRETNILINR